MDLAETFTSWTGFYDKMYKHKYGGRTCMINQRLSNKSGVSSQTHTNSSPPQVLSAPPLKSSEDIEFENKIKTISSQRIKYLESLPPPRKFSSGETSLIYCY